MLFAAAVPNDRHHARAVESLAATESGSVTTDHVLVETWTLINARRGHHAASRAWSALRSSPLTIECVTPVDLERAYAIAERWDDQTFSMVDCTSFAVMERLGMDRVATFDDDFAVYRYGPDRDRAFTILR